MMNRTLGAFLVIAFLMPANRSMSQEAPHPLTLKEAIQLALRNNLNIQGEVLNPEIAATDVDKSKSKFEPLLSGTLNAKEADQPTTSRLVGVGTLHTTTVDFGLQLDQTLNTGTNYNLSFQNARSSSDQLFTIFNPQYNSSFLLSVTQPLLRNFGLQITQTPVEIAKTSKLAADEQLQVRMLDIALQVEQAYWEWIFAIQNLDVQKQALRYAQDLLESNKQQVDLGKLAPMEVVVAEAQVAADEQGLITAEAAIGNEEDTLRTLIYGESVGNQAFLPADQAVAAPFTMTEDEAVHAVLDQNPDLKALRLDLQVLGLNAKLARNELKSQLDLKGSIGFTGVGGKELLYADGFNGNPIGALPGGYGDALSNLVHNPAWGVGLELGVPIGNGAAKADYARATLLQKQSSINLETMKQQILLNVRTTIRNLKSDLKRVDAAHASEVLQQKKLDAERDKLEVGLSTNNVVLQFATDLATAQASVHRAVTDYKKDLAQLNRYLGIF